MKMIIRLSSYCLLMFIIALPGCSLIPLHKPDIEQGNIVTAEMMQQLKVGMTKQQVLYLLGTPILENNFIPTQWYYVYTFQSGKNNHFQRKYLIVKFENNVVAEITNAYPIEPFHRS